MLIVQLLLAISNESTNSVINRRLHAKELIETSRYREAAHEFELIWNDTKDPADLYNAALAHFNLRNYAHALIYLNRLLEYSLDSTRIEDVKILRNETLPHLINVPIKIKTTSIIKYPLSLLITLRIKGKSDLKLPILVKNNQSILMFLDPGIWTLDINDFRFDPISITIDTNKQFDFIELELQSREIAKRKQIFASTWGGFGLGLITIGSGFLIDGQLRWKHNLKQRLEECGNIYPVAKCRKQLSSAVLFRSFGVASLSAGIGSAIGGLTVLTNSRKNRNKFWILESSIGSSIIIGGIIMTYFGSNMTKNSSLNPWIRNGDEDRLILQKGTNLHFAGSALLGFGSGLLTSALSGILVQKRNVFLVNENNVKINLTGFGLEISGKF